MLSSCDQAPENATSERLANMPSSREPVTEAILNQSSGVNREVILNCPEKEPAAKPSTHAYEEPTLTNLIHDVIYADSSRFPLAKEMRADTIKMCIWGGISCGALAIGAPAILFITVPVAAWHWAKVFDGVCTQGGTNDSKSPF